jgi:hypothetical protein
MLGYAVSNDKDYLYITAETGDPATQLKILKEGLTVWIDKKGEKEEVTAINYPIPVNAGKSEQHPQKHIPPPHGQPGLENSSQQKQRLELEDEVRAALEDAKEYSLQGFKSCNLQFPISETDSCGIVVRISIDADNELIWEAKVPFKSFYSKPQVTRADKGKPITICFETTAMQRPAGQRGGSSSPGGSRGFQPTVGFGSMGMGMGMNMGGGGMQYRGGQNNPQRTADIMEPAYKTTKTYKKFGIAYLE